MMTSRAEYRLLLRQDNADLRLTEIGHEIGLIDDDRYRGLLEKREQIEKEISRLERTVVGGTEKVQKFLESQGSTLLKNGVTLAELVKRPELSYEALSEIDEDRPSLPLSVREQVEINLKYEGYLKRQESQIRQFKKLEGKKLPEDFDYESIKGLRREAMQKLNQLRPVNIGQASRISGVSPADISVLLVYLEQRKKP